MLDVSFVNPDDWKDKQEITVKAQQEEAFAETPTVGTKQQRSAQASFPMETGLIKNV